MADEVRQLAGRTSAATEEIVSVVQQNQTLVEVAVREMANSREQAAQGLALANQAGEVIVESRIVDTTIDKLRLGMPMELVIVPFDDHRCTYAFRPEQRA